MTYTSRYLVPLSLTLGACLWACGSSNDIPDSTPGDGDGDGTGTGGLAGDGDGDGSGGLAGDGDGDGSGGLAGDGDGDGTGGAMAMGDPAGESCDLGTNYSLGEMRILNNQWSSPQPDQCIFINADRSFGWKWNNEGDFNDKDGVPSMNPNYPEVEFGINPWGLARDPWEIDSSSTPLLPIRLADLTSASMTIDVSSTSNGAHWNLAFELWLSPVDPTVQSTTPSAELMVFFVNDAGYFPETAETETTLNGYTLFYSDDMWADGYEYRQWRKDGSAGSSTSFNGTLDIKSFLDQSDFDSNWYVTRFEIGNEVYTGSTGETTITSLSFEVNGQTRNAL